jgi:subtilisin family serine protease
MVRLLWSLAVLLALAACAVVPTAPPAPRGVDLKMGQAAQSDSRPLILVTMTEPEHRRLTEGGDVAAATLPPRYGELLRRWEQRFGIRRVADWPLSSIGVRCLVFEITGARTSDDVVRALAATELVETAQPLQQFEVLAEPYNDPYVKLQHGFASMNVAAAHRWATGRGVRVAVIDTGLDSAHPELAGRVQVKRNLVNGDPAQFDDDVHGTAVAGVIGAAANNAQGLVGVAPQAEILGLKACWQAGPGYGGAVCNSFTLAKALNVAIGEAVDVINLSLGGPADALLSRLVERAIASDIVVVGSVDRRHPGGFPAAVPGVIAVTEVLTRSGAADAALLAPGEQIISARPRAQYDMYSGSSVAAAQVSGVVALIRERKPHLAPRPLAALLRSTVDPQSGEINACRALALLAGQANSACAPTRPSEVR